MSEQEGWESWGVRSLLWEFHLNPGKKALLKLLGSLKEQGKSVGEFAMFLSYFPALEAVRSRRTWWAT